MRVGGGHRGWVQEVSQEEVGLGAGGRHPVTKLLAVGWLALHTQGERVGGGYRG